MTHGSGDDERLSMDRRTALKLGAVGTATAVGTSGTATADESQTHYHNPIGPQDFGDPSVIQASDGTYYVYVTGMEIARSQDLVNWDPIGRALTEDQVEWRDEGGLWAPHINYYDDQYYLYYSYSTFGSQDNPGIGLATASNPEGPFTDRGPVFRTRDLPLTNTIDPTMVVLGPDEEENPQGPSTDASLGNEGTPYMVWGSYWGIYGVELTPDGRDYVPGTHFHMAGDMKEGPMMIPHDGYWYLLYSTGHCCAGPDSTYGIEVGRSESFFGPYYTRDGRDLRNVDEHHEGTNILRGTATFIGPGHNTAIQDDDGDWWMLYHVEANAIEDEPGRYMMLDPITWDDEGWPVVNCDGVPSTRNPVPGSDEDICSSPDPAADSDYFRAVFVADDVEERLEPNEADYYEQEDVLVQQAVLDREEVIERDIEDVGRSSERLASLPEEIREHFDYPGDGLQPIQMSNRVSVGFDILPPEDFRLSFAIYTYPNDDLDSEVESAQELVDSTTKLFPPADHRVALDVPWDETDETGTGEEPDETETFYQVDFVAGEPIEELGEEGLYADEDRLLRFAFGNPGEGFTERGSAWASADVRDCLADYGHIGRTDDGAATVTFTVADGCELTLSLAVHSMPGETFDRETADRQELLRSTTEQFGPGEHTITVPLPTDREA